MLRSCAALAPGRGRATGSRRESGQKAWGLLNFHAAWVFWRVFVESGAFFLTDCSSGLFAAWLPVVDPDVRALLNELKSVVLCFMVPVMIVLTRARDKCPSEKGSESK